MTTKFLLILSVTTLAILISVGQATDAFADGKIRLTSGVDVETIADQGAGDVNGIDGITKTLATVGVFDLDMTATSLSKPHSGNATNPDIDTAIVVVSSAGGTLLYEFTDTNFTGNTLNCRNFGGGTTDGTVTHTVYVDPGNAEFAQTTQVFQSVNPGLNIVIDLNNSTSPNGPFSVTVVSEIVHNAQSDQTSFSIITKCEPEEIPEWSASTDSNPQGGIPAPVENPVDTVNIIADANFPGTFSGIWKLDDSTGTEQSGNCTGGAVNATTGLATLTCDATGLGPFGVFDEEICWTIDITAPAGYVPPTDTLDGTGIPEECFTVLISHHYFVGGGRVDVNGNSQADAFALSTKNNRVMATFKITHGFELHCDVNSGPNNLEVNWDKSQFHLEQLTSVICNDDGSVNEPPPSPDSGFPNGPGPTTDVYNGEGFGRYNGECGAFAQWVFDDNGEPGKADHIVALKVTDAGGTPVLEVNPGLLGVIDTAYAGDAKNHDPDHTPLLDLRVGNHQWVPHKAGSHGPTQTNPCPEEP